jgi:uncharacterized protein
VDGYNVISCWSELREIKDYSLDSARQKLLDYLQNYATYKGYKVFVVFDAHMKNGSIQKKEIICDNLIEVFTKEGETADSYIERTVNNIGRKIEVCVITSDSLEQQLIFQRGAIRMSSLEFYFEIKEAEEKIRNKTQKQYSDKKHLLEDRIEQEVLEKLEKIRRSR